MSDNTEMLEISIQGRVPTAESIGSINIIIRGTEFEKLGSMLVQAMRESPGLAFLIRAAVEVFDSTMDLKV